MRSGVVPRRGNFTTPRTAGASGAATGPPRCPPATTGRHRHRRSRPSTAPTGSSSRRGQVYGPVEGRRLAGLLYARRGERGETRVSSGDGGLAAPRRGRPVPPPRPQGRGGPAGRAGGDRQPAPAGPPGAQPLARPGRRAGRWWCSARPGWRRCSPAAGGDQSPLLDDFGAGITAGDPGPGGGGQAGGGQDEIEVAMTPRRAAGPPGAPRPAAPGAPAPRPAGAVEGGDLVASPASTPGASRRWCRPASAPWPTASGARRPRPDYAGRGAARVHGRQRGAGGAGGGDRSRGCARGRCATASSRSSRPGPSTPSRASAPPSPSSSAWGRRDRAAPTSWRPGPRPCRPARCAARCWRGPSGSRRPGSSSPGCSPRCGARSTGASGATRASTATARPSSSSRRRPPRS